MLRAVDSPPQAPVYFEKAIYSSSNGTLILENTSFPLSKPQMDVKQSRVIQK